MFKTIITRSSNERMHQIFQSNSKLKFDFFPYYNYEILPVNQNFVRNINEECYSWIIYTSYKSWKFINKQLKDNQMNIPVKTKVGVFGPETALRVIESGGRVDFMEKAKNASEFATKLVSKLDYSDKIAYPCSFVADSHIEEVFIDANIKISRQNIYKPVSILNTHKIKEMIYNSNPDSIVFLSAGSAKSFMENCSEEQLDKVKNMKLFAIGPKTASALENYAYKDISIPALPDINTLSKMVYDFADNYKQT